MLVSDANRLLLRFIHDLQLFHEHPHPVGASLPEDLLAFFGLLAVGAGLGRVISINQFSLHGMYRSRLVRTFLGVSRPKTGPAPERIHGIRCRPTICRSTASGTSARPCTSSTRR